MDTQIVVEKLSTTNELQAPILPAGFVASLLEPVEEQILAWILERGPSKDVLFLLQAEGWIRQYQLEVARNNGRVTAALNFESLEMWDPVLQTLARLGVWKEY